MSASSQASTKRDEFVALLRLLSEAFGPSGFEDEVRRLVVEKMRPLVDELSVDKWGNVIGTLRGSAHGPSVMVAAHVDEIGLMIDQIDEKGFLRFRAIGGWNEVTLVGQRVILRGRKRSSGASTPVIGVIGGRPPHVTPPGKEREAPELKELFIDAGFTSREEAERAGIGVGSVAVLDRSFDLLAGDAVTGKALDDRVGVAVMLSALQRLGRHEATIHFVATVQEEVGLRGAQVAADALNPDVAVALDTTIAADVPGVPDRESVTKLGKGPAIKLMDGGRGGLFIAHPKLDDFLVRVAEEHKIPYQLEVLIGGSTDAQAIAFRRAGVPATTISIPTRYVHSPVEVLSASDALGAADLLAAALGELDSEVLKSLSFR
ncbi:MAG: M42 family metallopeptidase [Candidatus Marsarchaeota archaeon]